MEHITKMRPHLRSLKTNNYNHQGLLWYLDREEDTIIDEKIKIGYNVKMLAIASEGMFVDYYNHKIRDFLLTEFYDAASELTYDKTFNLQYERAEFYKTVRKLKEENILDLEDELVPFFGNYSILKEDLARCYQVALDLCNWSRDFLYHRLDNLHQLALYNFLCYIAHWASEDDYIETLYFSGKEDAKEILKIWKEHQADIKQAEIMSLQELTEYLHDIWIMADSCFEDIDFVTFPWLLSNAVANDNDMPTDLVEDYAEILPKDILDHYKHIHHENGELSASINEMLNEVGHSLKYQHEYKLLWMRDQHKDELGVHDYLGSVMRNYFNRRAVQIDREVDTGSGRVDFRLMDNNANKVLIEVKLASNPNLRAGLHKQLIRYMYAERCQESYYVICCFTEQEIETGQKLAKSFHPEGDKKIIIKILDATKKQPASKL